MWYLYSLLFCCVIAILLIIKVVYQAKCNGTPLTDAQICFVGVSMIILMCIPLLNIIFGIEIVYSFIFKPYELESEIDGLIDVARKSVR